MIPKPDKKIPLGKRYYSTQEAAEAAGLNQTTLTLWLRNNIIDDSTIKRDAEGRRLWTKDNINMIRKIKKQEGWM